MKDNAYIYYAGILLVLIGLFAGFAYNGEYDKITGNIAGGSSCSDFDGDLFSAAGGGNCCGPNKNEQCQSGLVDCNDRDPNIFPSATERCNNKDDNCNGQIDEYGGGRSACDCGYNMEYSGLCSRVIDDWSAVDYSYCMGNSCAMVCKPSHIDCDGQNHNGCEVATKTDVNNCGNCGTRCGPGKNCTNGMCVSPQASASPTVPSATSPSTPPSPPVQPPQQPACANECNNPNRDKRCAPGINGYQTCTRNAQGCSIWGSINRCPAGQACSNGACIVKKKLGAACASKEECEKNSCLNGKCTGACGLDSECAQNLVCMGRVCKQKTALGGRCYSNAHCLSGKCGLTLAPPVCVS